MVPYGEPETTITLPIGNIYTYVSGDIRTTSPTATIDFPETVVEGTQTILTNYSKDEFRWSGNRKSRRTEAAKARKRKNRVKSRPIRK